jgi:hypothetical protein
MLFGNAPRDTDAIRAQFLNNWDFSISKNTAIKEKLNVLFRAEFFDLFNHPTFGNAGSELGANGYNQATPIGNRVTHSACAPASNLLAGERNAGLHSS